MANPDPDVMTADETIRHMRSRKVFANAQQHFLTRMPETVL